MVVIANFYGDQIGLTVKLLLKPVTGELLYGDKGREHLEEEAPCDRFPVDHGRVHKYLRIVLGGQGLVNYPKPS
ncbi:MAG: hypothetical protein C4B57_08160 [Deltaproteobacteria bacterium]|nr:MAG: hypothetical protein C4B57_08160 [Deltaproteobacteria bacterium]